MKKQTRKSKIEIKKTNNPFRWYFRVKARNGEILCHSEVYTTKQECEQGVNALLLALVDATISKNIH